MQAEPAVETQAGLGVLDQDGFDARTHVESHRVSHNPVQGAAIDSTTEPRR
jgi:hypothetical protein